MCTQFSGLLLLYVVCGCFVLFNDRQYRHVVWLFFWSLSDFDLAYESAMISFGDGDALKNAC